MRSRSLHLGWPWGAAYMVAWHRPLLLCLLGQIIDTAIPWQQVEWDEVPEAHSFQVALAPDFQGKVKMKRVNPLLSGLVRTSLWLNLPREKFDSGVRNVTKHLSMQLGFCPSVWFAGKCGHKMLEITNWTTPHLESHTFLCKIKYLCTFKV